MDYHQSSDINEKDTYRHATGGEQHDTVSPAHTHALTGNSAGGKQHDPVLALTCVVLPKILATTQPTSIIFVSFTLSQESPVLKKASHPTSIRDADWYQSLFQQEATQPSAQSNFTLREPI